MKKLVLILLSCVIIQSALGYKWTVTNNWPQETRVKVVRMGTLDKDDEARAVNIPSGATNDIDLGGAYCGNGIQTKSPATSKNPYSSTWPMPYRAGQRYGCSNISIKLANPMVADGSFKPIVTY